RSPIDVTPTSTGDAAAALERIDALVRRAAGLDTAAAAPEMIEQFRSAMDDDLDTPAAMGLLFDAVRRANTALDAGDSATAAPLVAAGLEICRAVGLVPNAGDDEVPADVQALVAQRDAARKTKDFAPSDRLRDELTAKGWVIEDGPDGATVRRA